MSVPAFFPPNVSLTELLARCRAYEPAAQWTLYARFATPMLKLCQRYAPSLADAEDILQDAFIKIFQKLPEQREEAAFAGWVRRIVVSTAVDAWRHRRARRFDFDLDEAQHLPAPDASVIERLTVDEVRTLIDQLPAGCRLVLLLYTVEGYSHAEIGQLLGIVETASTAQLARARQRLTLLARAASLERTPPRATSADEPRPFNPLTTLLFQ